MRWGERGPLGGASVTCDGTRVATLFDGTYAFEHLPPATYRLTASLKGFEAQTRTAQVGSEEELTLDFWLERAQGSSSICGYVRNVESGNPISLGGTVIIILPAANLYALIDHDGRYEFYGLTAGVYELWVSAPGYEDLEATVEVKEGEKKAKDFYCLPSRAVEPPWG